MKKSILAVLIALSGVAVSAIVTSCTKKDDPNTCKTTCINGGTCVNGSCKCPPGYEGEACEIKSLNKFTGDWKVTENMSLAGSNDTLDTTNYTIKISPSNSSTTTDLLIDNLANAGNEVRLKGKVADNKLTILADTIEGKIYALPSQGSGIALTNDSTMNIRFTVTDLATGTLEKDRQATLKK